MLSASAGSPRLEWWGRVTVAGAAAISLAVLVVLAGLGPAPVLLLPVALVGFAGLLLLTRLPELYQLVLILAAGALVANQEEGLQVTEVLYGLSMYGYLALWYSRYLLSGRCLLRSSADVAAALFIVLGLGGGTLLGFIYGAHPVYLRGEVISTSMFLFYFPVKEAIVRHRQGGEIVGGILVWFGFFSAIRLALLFHAILTGAKEWWQVLDARVSTGEVQFIAALLTTVGLLSVSEGRKRFVLLAMTAVIGAGLVMSKSRGPWVAAALGFMVLIPILPRASRMRLAGLIGVAVALAVAGGYLMLGDAFHLIIQGLVKRIVSIDGAATQDPSLLNRWAESGGALKLIRQNPILGYGWGVPIPYNNLLFQGLVADSFLHNGYLALWVKVGLWGSGLFFWVWLSSMWNGFLCALERTMSPVDRALGAAATSILAGFLFLTFLSNPMILMEQMTIVTVVLALATGLRQRHMFASMPSTPPPPDDPS